MLTIVSWQYHVCWCQQSWYWPQRRNIPSPASEDLISWLVLPGGFGMKHSKVIIHAGDSSWRDYPKWNKYLDIEYQEPYAIYSRINWIGSSHHQQSTPVSNILHVFSGVYNVVFHSLSLSKRRTRMSLFVCVWISAILALCEGNPPVTGGFPSQRSVTRSFNVFVFDLRLNKRLSKQWKRRWFETPSSSLWRHCTVGLISSAATYGFDRVFLSQCVIQCLMVYLKFSKPNPQNWKNILKCLRS